MMIKTWILLIYMSSGGVDTKSGGPSVIDNIYSQAECERVQAVVRSAGRADYTHCIEVARLK